MRGKREVGERDADEVVIELEEVGRLLLATSLQTLLRTGFHSFEGLGGVVDR